MKKEYFLGLDVGSNSVGYAVTDMSYNIRNFNRKAMWGSHVFDAGSQSDERRAFRSSRRRLNRKKQRVELARELFAKEIAKVDNDFYIRLDESNLLRSHATLGSSYTLFSDTNMTDKDYHKEYPTIHHLIMHLINSESKEDIRLIYLAVSYMLTKRGHFLIEVDKDDIGNVTSFATVYDSFRNVILDNSEGTSWSKDIQSELGDVLKAKLGIRKKQSMIKNLISPNGKKIDKRDDTIIKAISGGKFKLSDLFGNDKYNDVESNSIALSENDLDVKMLAIADEIEESEFELLSRMKGIYDWSLLSDILMGNEFISQGKIQIYEQHKADLALLRRLVREYAPDKYNEVFRFSKKGLDNYSAYSGNFKSVSNKEKGTKKIDDLELKKTDNEGFCKYLKNKVFKNITVNPGDEKDYNDFKSRLDIKNAFMPKQVSTENSVIPYQLIRHQLKALLENSARFHPFLMEKDDDNLSVIDKLLSIIEFRIPYYVGPLNNYHGKFSWIERKAEGRILPWNFKDKVDLDKSEEAFIRRMTCKCTYLAGEDVLCKNSLLYSKYMVLNEINNIKIDDEPITVGCKQRIYTELFEDSSRKVTRKRLKDWLVSNNYMHKDQELRGVDDNIKSSLRSYHSFKNLLSKDILSHEEAERIIQRISITTDYERLKVYLKTTYPKLSSEDIKYISNIRFKDYGRLSKKLLTGIIAVTPKTGECTNIIEALWLTNHNFMELISSRFDFATHIDRHNRQYYDENPHGISEMLDEMYVSNSVKRPIFRAIDIAKEIKTIMKSDPKKIFIEMSRWHEQTPKRTKSRKEQLLELYKSLDKEYKEEWSNLLEKESDDKLKSQRLFLYYMQLGRCMYTGEKIQLNQLFGKTYDIDHIYPQSKVKDDSIHNNKVLVNSTANKLKSDTYPLCNVDSNWQKNMAPFWSMLQRKGLLNKEKLYRLTRVTGFKQEELANFINRQLVETQQSTKAIARILESIFPDTEIVYVKAGLVSDFRNQFKFPKSREINDFHHAKDAYLNIVIGNVYNVKFTKNPLNFIKSGEKYSINIKMKDGLLSRNIERNGEIAWISGGPTIGIVRRMMQKNNVNYVRYAFCRKGGLFDQLLLKAPYKENQLIPKKKDLPTDIYGGYNKPTASFFTLVKHYNRGKPILSILAVDLLVADKFKEDDIFAINYCEERYGLENAEFIPLRKVLKINTVLSLDGFRVNLTSKSDGGKRIGISSCVSLVLSPKYESYVQKIESAMNKKSKMGPNRNDFKIYEKHDKITTNENIEIYQELMNKCKANIFAKITTFEDLYSTMESGKELFESLSIEDQTEQLLNIINVFKTGRRSGCNLQKIGGTATGSVMRINSKISSTKFKSIEIIDQSPTGLFEKKSGNLLKL